MYLLELPVSISAVRKIPLTLILILILISALSSPKGLVVAIRVAKRGFDFWLKVEAVTCLALSLAD